MGDFRVGRHEDTGEVDYFPLFEDIRENTSYLDIPIYVDKGEALTFPM